MFLARRHHAVISVPWFEWDELRGREEKKVYVAEKLRGARVYVPSSAQQLLRLQGAALAGRNSAEYSVAR